MDEKMNTEALTPLDSIMPRTYTRLLFVFRCTAPLNEILPGLQSALDATSTQVPWLRGVISQPDSSETKKPALQFRWSAKQQTPHINDSGTIIETYEAYAARASLLDAIPSTIWPVQAFVDDETHEAGAPVFLASAFRFGDLKGVGLVICLHHYAADASGFANVVGLWVRNMAAAGLKAVIEPRLDRLSDAISTELQLASEKPLDDLIASHPEYTLEPFAMPEFPACTSKILRLPVSRIDDYKAKLLGHTSVPPTTNTVICALHWSTITRIRMSRNPDIFAQGTSKLGMAVDGRKRISPDFSTPEQPYLGNVNLYSSAEASPQDLSTAAQGTMPDLAKICDAIVASNSPSKINTRHIAEAYSLISRLDDYTKLNAGWNAFNGPDLTITSWANLGLYDLDFGTGLGRPEFVRVPYAEWDGLCIVLPRKRVAAEASEDVVEVVVMLRRDDMATLDGERIWERAVA